MFRKMGVRYPECDALHRPESRRSCDQANIMGLKRRQAPTVSTTKNTSTTPCTTANTGPPGGFGGTAGASAASGGTFRNDWTTSTKKLKNTEINAATM